MDLPTGVAIAGSALASKDIIVKVLGPTADYVGGEIKNLIERCNLNLNDVFASSLRKGAENQSGAVDARTAKSIFDDAAYCDDALIKDYYGGFLCGAKSELRNDAALSYVSIIKGMSRVQVRTHFLIYAILHKQVAGQVTTLTKEEDRRTITIAMGLDKYLPFLGISQDSDWEAVLNHVVSGLMRADLIGQFYRYGSVEYINSVFPELYVKKPSLVVTPSILGAELFLWAAGYQSANPNLILKVEEDILIRFPEEFSKWV